ncbi:hypothetical protein INT43_005067 [Umbelopsis isabellina]|uniref:Uncharacterized protein n=1 Tax=Mortierella isabellina TaxID=91625 RepID=A0A8H7UBM5_MORIS|nr:hypothetical protein INT43_005067 [Umbelopsis isabellina]
MKNLLNNAYSKTALDDELFFLKYGSTFNEKLGSDTCMALTCEAFDINSVYKVATAVLENQSIQYSTFIKCIDTWLTSRMIEWREVFELRKTEAEVASTRVLDIDHHPALFTLQQIQPDCIVLVMDSHNSGKYIVQLEIAAAVLKSGLQTIFTEVEMTSRKVKDYYKKVNSVRILCQDQEIKRVYHHLAITLLHFLSTLAIYGDLSAAKHDLNNVGLASVAPSSLTTEYVTCINSTYNNLLVPCSQDFQNEYNNLLSTLDIKLLRLDLETLCPALNDWLDVSDSACYDLYKQVPYLETITSRGFKKDVRLTVGMIFMLLISALIGVTGWALSNHQTLQNYNIDPTSLISLCIVVEGLLLAAFVALYAENWSWHDMVRGQLYVMDFEELGDQSRAINKVDLIRHVIDNASHYEHIVSRNYLCYVDYDFKGNIVMPHGLTVYELKKVGYSVMRTSKAYYVRRSFGDKHRIAHKVTRDGRILHVEESATPEGVPIVNYENLIVAGTMDNKHTTVINIE